MGRVRGGRCSSRDCLLADVGDDVNSWRGQCEEVVNWQQQRPVLQLANLANAEGIDARWSCDCRVCVVWLWLDRSLWA